MHSLCNGAIFLQELYGPITNIPFIGYHRNTGALLTSLQIGKLMQLAHRSYGHIVAPPWQPPKASYLYGALALLLTLLTVCMHQASRPPRSLQPSSAEYINAGRYFMDHLFSINAGTVVRDQERAIKMMVDPNLVRERLAYLKSTRLIQEARTSDGFSHLDWQQATAKLIEQTPQYTTIELSSVLQVGTDAPRNVHMIITLVPVPRSEHHPDGVGVLKWTEVT